MNHLPIIIKREYLNRIRNRSFVLMTFLTPFIAAILIVVVSYLSKLNNDKQREIAVLDKSGIFKEDLKSTENIIFTFQENNNLEKTKKETLDQGLYGLLYIPKVSSLNQFEHQIRFYTKESPSILVVNQINSLVSKKITNLRMLKNNVDVAKINALKTNVSVQIESFKGEQTSEFASIIKLIFGGIAGYLLFMFIVVYGNMIMRSVIEEKTNRIIEIIVSSVKPIQLMLGKIIGTSLAGITQFVIWVFMGGAIVLLVSAMLGIEATETQLPQTDVAAQQLLESGMLPKIKQLLHEFMQLPWANLIIAFLWFFVGGYLLYSSIYAAIGAAVDNETDTQQFMIPVLVPLILAVYIGAFTVIENPHGSVSTVFSMIPLTSPVVMLMRIPFGVPLWQQIISIILLIASFLLVVWIAAKVYRTGILTYGKKVSYKELYKWIKY